MLDEASDLLNAAFSMRIVETRNYLSMSNWKFYLQTRNVIKTPFCELQNCKVIFPKSISLKTHRNLWKNHVILDLLEVKSTNSIWFSDDIFQNFTLLKQLRRYFVARNIESVFYFFGKLPASNPVNNLWTTIKKKTWEQELLHNLSKTFQFV